MPFLKHFQVEMVKFLLNRNANPAKSNKNGWTALHQGGSAVILYCTYHVFLFRITCFPENNFIIVF